MSHMNATLTTLAAQVAELTATITSHLRSASLPEPTFAADSPAQYPPVPELAGPRLRLVQALSDMLILAMGARDYIFTFSINTQHDLAVLNVLNQFNFWDAVPITGSATHGEVARRTGLPDELVRRMVRHAATMRIFVEQEEEEEEEKEDAQVDGDLNGGKQNGEGWQQNGQKEKVEGNDRNVNGERKQRRLVVKHTSASALLARSQPHRCWVAHHMEESQLACTRLPEALRRYSLGKETPAQGLGETAFAVAFGGQDQHQYQNGQEVSGEGGGTGNGKEEKGKVGGVTFWDVLREDGEGDKKGFRTPRFAQAMMAGRSSSGVDFLDLLQKGFDWEALGEGAVVDVGGSSGHDAVVLAQNYPKLKVIVQDLPRVQEAFDNNVPSELRSRISFQAHDFFTPQPVAADVYFFKAILHDWPDEYAARILANLVPAMRPGTRVVLCEGVFPASRGGGGGGDKGWQSLPLPSQRALSSMDLQMLVLFNSKQRTVDDWRQLVSTADARFELVNVYRRLGTPFGLIEVVFRG